MRKWKQIPAMASELCLWHAPKWLEKMSNCQMAWGNHDEGGEPHAGVTHTLFARSGHSKKKEEETHGKCKSGTSIRSPGRRPPVRGVRALRSYATRWSAYPVLRVLGRQRGTRRLTGEGLSLWRLLLSLHAIFACVIIYLFSSSFNF